MLVRMFMYVCVRLRVGVCVYVCARIRHRWHIVYIVRHKLCDVYVCVCTRWSNAAGCQHLGHHGELGRVGLAGEADGDARHHQLLARRGHLHATTRAKPRASRNSLGR